MMYDVGYYWLHLEIGFVHRILDLEMDDEYNIMLCVGMEACK